MAPRGRTKWSIFVAGGVLAASAFAGPSYAQIIADGSTRSGSSTTTTLLPSPTTAPGSSTTTTAPASTTTEPAEEPGGGPPPSGSEAPGSEPAGGDDFAGDGDGGGDGDAGAPITWGTVPAEAQKVIDSVVRTPANSSRSLYDGVGELVDLGLTREEAIRLGFGRFPVAGVANYSHDWLFPRYGPGFRFHKGTDVFAPFGTPLRAIVEGTVAAKNSSLGGLTVKLFTDDGTYFYYAHLSALVDGFTDGMQVETGDIIGYVGDSGNARGGSPHLHLGIYPQGGDAIDPKPVLDQFLADAAERLPSIVDEVKRSRSAAAPAAPEPPRSPRSLLATSLLRPLTERTATADVPTEILYQATGNPPAGGASIAQSEAEHLAGSIDWQAWQTRSQIGRDLQRRTEALLRVALGDRWVRATDLTETADG